MDFLFVEGIAKKVNGSRHHIYNIGQLFPASKLRKQGLYAVYITLDRHKTILVRTTVNATILLTVFVIFLWAVMYINGKFLS